MSRFKLKHVVSFSEQNPKTHHDQSEVEVIKIVGLRSYDRDDIVLKINKLSELISGNNSVLINSEEVDYIISK